MRYRKMPVSGLAKVTVPQLNGGVNVYDVPNRVGDNQLTECNNLWWHSGALRTRPGLALDTEKWVKTHTFTARQPVGDRELLLTQFETKGENAIFQILHTDLTDGCTHFGGHEFAATDGLVSALGIRAPKSRSKWYFLLSNGDVIVEETNGEGGNATPYIPTVMINGVGEDCEADAEPSAYEDYNMLTRAFQCHYTTDGVSTTWKLPMGNLATDLPGVERESEAGGTVAKVELDVYGENGLRTVEVSLVYNECGRVPEQSIPLSAAEAGVTGYGDEVELRVRVDAAKGVLYTQLWETVASSVGAQVTQIPSGLPFLVANNLRITAWRSREYEKNRLTICGMTRGEWFGGDVSGIAGGTRFFVCGNPDEPDLLCWSGIEHPLYFPEHNRVRVGDDHQAITAMGKQGSLLVLYKEREMHAMQYSSGTESDYDFAQSGGVAVTSYMAQFLLIPINAGVGCDCPDTVRLVNNRLVWANSDGEVYMLTATNQYSERNVRMISRNVRRLLTDCGKEALQNAQAGEYEGYYLLLVENRMFLMNTQTSAFTSFNYYDDENTAAKAIPWFVWTLPGHLTYTGMVSGQNTVKLSVTDSERGEGTIAMLEGDTDDGAPIPCRMKTKLWDFGIADHKKSVEHIYMGLGCADISRVQVSYITDRGRIFDSYRMKNSVEGQEGYLLRRHLTPNVRMVQAFGLCLDSPTGLELDEIKIKVRQQGVVR